MSNLLVIDYDFFFPNPIEAGDLDNDTAFLYDWGHAEAPLFVMLPLWLNRATAFINNNIELPGVVPPDGGWEEFWDRFAFSADATLTYADSNAHAGLIQPADPQVVAFENVVLFDAHHDSGYGIKSYTDYLSQTALSCEDWMLEHQRSGTENLTVRYPQWKGARRENPLPEGVITRQVVDDGEPLDLVFSHVFVCRSGAWVPPWCDHDFVALVNACPLDGEQVDDTQLVRGFDVADAERLAVQMKTTMANLPGR